MEAEAAAGAPAKKKSRAGRDLPAALIVGFSLFFLVIAAFLWFPVGVPIILSLLSILGVFELHSALALAGMSSARAPLAVLTPAIIISGCAQLWDPRLEVLPWGLTGLAVLTVLLWRLPGGAEGYTKDAAASLFTIGYLALLGSFIGPVLALPDGAVKLGLIFMCVCASDTGGYALGASLGKHQMAPNISPKKTWEGLVGSFLLGAVVGGLVAEFALHVPWWIGVLLSVIMTLFGTAGDLVESMIKRDVGIKDMSSTLPGHGGIMDRIDSYLVGIPVGWAFFTIAAL
ncbi:MAG: phosphatidate cytidylyltransferase [Propionibacteriaceae bacterium]|jgi:phosphatidate cytidylyltransferase|nr:phosphatidate cytidylyltransferase [Propionibacteriaceae bacterium]